MHKSTEGVSYGKYLNYLFWIRLDISHLNIPEQISSCRLPKCRLRDEVSDEWFDVDRRHRLSTVSTRTAVKTCWRWGCTSCPRSTWGRCDLRVWSSPSQFTNQNKNNETIFRHKTSQNLNSKTWNKLQTQNSTGFVETRSSNCREKIGKTIKPKILALFFILVQLTDGLLASSHLPKGQTHIPA